MKGGKRLSEDERVEWFWFVHAQNKRIVTVERKVVIYKEIIDDLEAWLERDDDPEFCTWTRSFDGHFNISCADITHKRANGRWKGAQAIDGQTWEFDYCPYCGKPVKGE